MRMRMRFDLGEVREGQHSGRSPNPTVQRPLAPPAICFKQLVHPPRHSGAVLPLAVLNTDVAVVLCSPPLVRCSRPLRPPVVAVGVSVPDSHHSPHSSTLPTPPTRRHHQRERSATTMSTTLSMPSPHGHHALSHGAFATSLQLSPAFRSLHAAALRQRQHEFERLRELASDEFSDDESDGDEEEEEEDEGEGGDEYDSDASEEDAPVEQETAAEAAGEVEAREEDALGHDSDIDTDEVVLLPFIRPTVSCVAHSAPSNDFMSPKADDWTIVDKSPTCEGTLFANINLAEAWFTQP